MVSLLRQQLEEEEGKFPVSLDDADGIQTKEEEETEDIPKQKYFKLFLILSWLMIYLVLVAFRGSSWCFATALLLVLCNFKYLLAFSSTKTHEFTWLH